MSYNSLRCYFTKGGVLNKYEINFKRYNLQNNYKTLKASF